MPVRHCLFALLACLALACSPTVGDKCTTDSKCGTSLSCDLATPEGYCTKTPCRAGECPAEGTCVDFGAEKTFCMRTCDPDNECRSGLACRPAALCGPEAPTPTSASPCSFDAGLDAQHGNSFCGIPL